MTDQTLRDNPSDGGQLATGCGLFLRQARERAGLSLQEVGAELKMPARVLQALEEENWQQLGAAVFVRGQLRSYARRLKVDITPYLLQVELQSAPPAELISHSHTPHYRRVLESAARRAVYVVITAAIAVPVWVNTQKSDETPGQSTASLDMATPGSIAGQQTIAKRQAAAPVVASLTPMPRRSASALTLRMTGDSWVEISSADGGVLVQDLLKAGEERSFGAGEVGRVLLGNAAAVQVQQAGSTVDLTPYKRANVARFTVSSDGSLVPIAN